MKKYHISTVLSIVMNKLIVEAPENGMDSVHDILAYMMGGDIIIPQEIPKAMELCLPNIIMQFPQLVEIDTNAVITKDNMENWLQMQIEKYGAYFDIEPLDSNILLRAYPEN